MTAHSATHPVRIGFDRQTFCLQRYGGISRYFADLAQGLGEQPDVEARLLFRHHRNAYLEARQHGRQLGPLTAKLAIRAMQHGWSASTDRAVDVLHSTYYLGSPPRRRSPACLVSTLHDMIPENHPDYFRSDPHFNKIAWFEASAAIVCVSDTSAADLAYYHPHLAPRLTRIHLYSAFTAGSPCRRPGALSKQPMDYLLFVGHRQGYKNFALLLRAFATTAAQRSPLTLIVAGGGSFSAHEWRLIHNLGLAEHILQIDADDAELWYLYRHAAAVAVPSLAEGFSLPLVEALLADVPVLGSDIAVHREVAGPFATLLNPLQHQDWAEALQQLDRLGKPSDQLGATTYATLCKYYSRARMVQEHAALYRRLSC